MGAGTAMNGESQTYICYNKGCSSGGSFEAAPESWFRERGLTPPRNCPSCREWIKQQADESVECSACSWMIPVSAKRKISFHKREGRWQVPSMCTRCTLDPDRARRAAESKRRVRRAQRPKDVDPERAAELLDIVVTLNKYPGSPRSISISPDPIWWQQTTRDYREGTETLWSHIVSDHGNEIQTYAALSSPAQVPGYISDLASSTDGNRVVQFTQGDKVVKLDIMTSVALIFDPAAGTPVTCFPPERLSYIEGKIRSGVWR